MNVVAADVSLIPYAVTSCGTPSTSLRSCHRLAGADEAADITECSDERSKDDFLATSTMARLIVGTNSASPTRCRSIAASDSAGSNTGCTTTLPATNIAASMPST